MIPCGSKLPGKPFNQPYITGGHNLAEDERTAIWGCLGQLSLLGRLVQNAVSAVERNVQQRASGRLPIGDEETLAVCRPPESRQLNPPWDWDVASRAWSEVLDVDRS